MKLLKIFKSLKMKLINIRYIISLLLCLLSSAGVIAQSEDIEVNGIVKNSVGQPVEGATVLIQEKTQGIFTDKEGKFNITCSGNDRLVLKKAGFNTVYIAAYEIKRSEERRVGKEGRCMWWRY